MKKNYDPRDIELSLYQMWEKKGYFKSTFNLNKKFFCIVMPPPNITGNLHMGHAFQQTIMDILIRYNRMQGKNTLWQVGTDHAGIATQMIVERKIISEENKTKDFYGREKFVSKIWDWKKTTNVNITNQIRRLGSSVDWDRELFTLDLKVSQAVQEAFISLYQSNLIYRKKSLVNWDPKLQTVISDLEIEYRDSCSFMWYIKYYFVNDLFLNSSNSYIIIATTRPETIFADVAIAVNPNDSRYKNIIGQKVFIPLINRIIPIIGDDYVDIRKGSGCLKVSPAHDFNDYEIGCRHNLPMINIFTRSGKLREIPQIYNINIDSKKIKNLIIPKIIQKLDRFLAREKILILLKQQKFIEDIKKHSVSLPYGDRSNVIIEPRLTSQWFLRMSQMSSVAIEAVKEKKIVIIPNQYKNMYFSWMKNIKDWCISRQLWWGHRIPVWIDSNKNIYVGKNEVDVRQRNFIPKKMILRQEDDVLDTWFSSALWIFTSLGWPDNTNFLQKFYPTNVLVSGFDIIFFWIARMIMLSMHFIKNSKGIPKIPFKTVYITGLVNDEIGHKMSKSKGNIIDPIDVIDGITLADLLKKRTSNMMQKKLKEKIVRRTKKQFPNGIESSGTDALRITLASLASPNRNINWDMNRLRGYKNFCNKLWNIGRFILINIKDNNIIALENNQKNKNHFPDKWILITYNSVIKKYRIALDTYRFDLATTILFDFIKYNFCDWYLELVKLLFKRKTELELYGTKVTLINVLESILRLSHPIIPFITEEIWRKIKHFKGIISDSIMLQDFPKYNINLKNQDKYISADMLQLRNIITGLRNLRNKLNIKSAQKIPLYIINLNEKNHIFINKYEMYLIGLAKLKYIKLLTKKEIIPNSLVHSISGIELIIPIKDRYKNKVQPQFLAIDIKKIKAVIKKLKIKLCNKNFLDKAPLHIIVSEKNRLLNYEHKLQQLLLG